MRFLDINDPKFSTFEKSRLDAPNMVFGGSYPGETNNAEQGFSDQLKDDGSLDKTNYGSGKANDGFSIAGEIASY